MNFLKEGKTNWKFLLIVIILAAVAGGGILWWQSCGCPTTKGPISRLDRDCTIDEDCKYTCGCGAINKNETCDEEGITYDCVDHEVKCVDGQCVIGEEIIKDETADWETYRNKEYNYEFRYPENYRIANSIMQKKALEDETIREEYREEYSVEDLVVITNLSIEEEQEYLEICVDFYGGCYVSTNLPAGTISLRPFFTADLDIEAEIREQELHGTNGSELSDFRIEKTISGLEVRRWRLNWTMQGKDYEKASINLPEKVSYPPLYYGDTDYRYLDEINIMMQIGDDYEKELLVLDKVISTFKFTEETPQTISDPVIESISPNFGPIGTEVEIRGKNFSGFEGDLVVWIEDVNGEKGYIWREAGSNDTLIKFTLSSSYCQVDTSYSGLPCPKFIYLTPGTYKIYVYPWGVKSNEVTFTVNSQ